MSLIGNLFQALFEIILFLINLLLVPLNNLIADYVPTLDNILSYCGSFISLVGDYISFAFSYFGFYPVVIESICALIVAIVMIPFVVHSVKLIVKWYFILKP